MTAITILPKNKKELTALKHFIKALGLDYSETKSEDISTKKITSEEFENALKDSYTIDEFSERTTLFLEKLPWKK